MLDDRRQFLKQLTAAGGAIMVPGSLPAAGAASGTQTLPDNPFRLGVASGFPTDHSVVLWTRLACEPTQPDGAVPPLDWPVRYEVAADETFRRVVARGNTIAAVHFAHSVHVEVMGLSADRDYFYRFTAGGYRSQIGRTCTLPAPHARVAALHLAVASCQHYEHGHFAAWRHIAANHPQLIVHVGDYIYEGAPVDNRVRRHSGGVCRTLDDYRLRYALYRTDSSLQAAHAVAPWLATWDDHEVANDYSGDRGGRDEDPAEFLARRAAAYQAWYEHLPAPPSMAPRPDGGMRIYSRHRIGRLATIHLLDQRQYRSPQACPQPGRAGGNRFGDECSARLDPARTMLGNEQERWLTKGLRDHPAHWTVLAQGTLFSHVDELPGENNQYWSDAWTGYPSARQRLIDSLQKTRSENPVILSGDLHAFAVAGVNAIPERPDTALVATEFVTTSISSDPRPQSSLDDWRDNNANFQLLDGGKRGYLAVRFSERQLQVDLVGIDDVNQPESGRHVIRSYALEAGGIADLKPAAVRAGIAATGV